MTSNLLVNDYNPSKWDYS